MLGCLAYFTPPARTGHNCLVRVSGVNWIANKKRQFCLVSTQFLICNCSVSNILRTTENRFTCRHYLLHNADTDKTRQSEIGISVISSFSVQQTRAHTRSSIIWISNRVEIFCRLAHLCHLEIGIRRWSRDAKAGHMTVPRDRHVTKTAWSRRIQFLMGIIPLMAMKETKHPKQAKVADTHLKDIRVILV